MKFKLIATHQDDAANEKYKVTMEFEDACLDEVVINLENFLRASSFVFEGRLEIVEQECEHGITGRS